MSLRLEPVCTLAVTLTRPHELGEGPSHVRRIIPIVGGTASGPLLNGRILNVGADWQTVDAEGLAHLDARYAVETDDGAVIEVISQGLRHMSAEVAARVAAGEEVPPSDYYMRSSIRLQTNHPAYGWVNRSLFVASGGKSGSTVTLSVFRVA
ncbi:MAG: DUF3237 domain-containing protein [Novosphingobium sp.]